MIYSFISLPFCPDPDPHKFADPDPKPCFTFLLFLSRATERDDEDKWEADQDNVHRIQPGVFVAVV